MSNEEQELKALKQACRLVENKCRQLGKDCQITFGDTYVEVAPPSWAGSATGDNLFEALEDALRSNED